MDFHSVLHQWTARIRTIEHSANAVAAQGLMARCIVSVGRFPTMGEALTFLARRQAILDRLEKALSDAFNRRYAELTIAALKKYCTDERLAQFDERTRALAEKALTFTVETFTGGSELMMREWPLKRLEHSIMDMHSENDKLCRELYNTWCAMLKKEVSTRNIRELNATLEPIVRAAKLSKLDEDHLLEAIDDQAKGSMSAYSSFFSEERRAREHLMKMYAFKTNDLRLTETEDDFTFSEAVEQLKTRPTLEVMTAYEQRFYNNGPAHFIFMLDRTDEDAESFYLLVNGELYDLANENPFIRETVFRFVVDELGLDPRTDAAFVAQREVAMGGNRRDGHYFLYPLPAKNLTVAIGKGKNGDPRAHLWVFRGDLEHAKTMLAAATSPSFDEDLAEARRQKKTLAEADPSVNRNAFKGMYLDFSQIEEHFELRAHFDEELKQL